MEAWCIRRFKRVRVLLETLCEQERLRPEDVHACMQQVQAMLTWLIARPTNRLHLASPVVWAILLTVHALSTRRGQWAVTQAGAELASDPWDLYVYLRDRLYGKADVRPRVQPLGSDKRLRQKTADFIHIHNASTATPKVFPELLCIWWRLPPVLSPSTCLGPLAQHAPDLVDLVPKSPRQPKVIITLIPTFGYQFEIQERD